MSNISKLNSRFLSLLLFPLATLLSTCNNNKEKQVEKEIDNATIQKIANDNRNDSLLIDVKFSNKGATSFNIANKYLYNNFLEFINPSDTDTIISKKIPKSNESQLIKFLGFAIINGKVKEYRHYFLAPNNISKINFIFNKEGNVELEETKGIIILDELYNTYKSLKIEKKNTSRTQKKLKLKDTYLSIRSDSHFQTKSLIQLNDYLYLENLQRINPFDPEIEDYLTSTNILIKATPLDHLLFSYIKNRIVTFDYSKLNTMNYSSEYLHLISVGLFNFLRHEDNKGDKKYLPALNWLRKTKLYKRDSIFIKNEITTLSNLTFKENLKKIELLDSTGNEYLLLKVLEENPSDYYLIDFWATWCKPCLAGMKQMEKMDLPENLKVISLSVDKSGDKSKWKKLTAKLNQDISYLVVDSLKVNKDFLNFIEMQSIPRYILIDKAMNLIDQAFYHPKEPNFLPKLQDLKNHENW